MAWNVLYRKIIVIKSETERMEEEVTAGLL